MDTVMFVRGKYECFEFIILNKDLLIGLGLFIIAGFLALRIKRKYK